MDPLADLLAALRYRPVEIIYDLGGQPLRLFRVDRPDDLLDHITQEEYAVDERLPYWAELWPAALALAEHVLRRVPMAGRRVIELGAGMGLVSLAAARAGADVLATDYEEDALRFVRVNAAANGLPVRTALLDWRDVRLDPAETFDLVLASDVVYERRNHGPILDALCRLLRPGGQALLSDPQRTLARAFQAEALSRGFRLSTWATAAPTTHATHAGAGERRVVPIDIHTLSLAP